MCFADLLLCQTCSDEVIYHSRRLIGSSTEAEVIISKPSAILERHGKRTNAIPVTF